MSDFYIENHPVVFLKPRLSYPYAWVGHIPFAYLLIDLLRPRTLVELGTDSGNSYLAFCQAVAALNTGTHCTAIDSWEGDPHARRYGESVLESLKRYHDPRYGAFSRLHRSYFVDALPTFADGSVDLLHIDGLHTYEAVSEDFHTWLPKLSDRAVVIFHDSQVHERGFGVARFMNELREKYRVAEFEHSNGLGIALVGENVPEAFIRFMDAFETRGAALKRFFTELGDSLTSTSVGAAGARSEQVTPAITCRVYYRGVAEEFESARASIAELTDPQGLQLLDIAFPDNVRPAFVRIDPADHPGVFELSGLSLVVGEHRIHSEDLPSRVRHYNGDLVASSTPRGLRLVSFGDDPYVELDISDLVEAAPASGPIRCSFTVNYEVVVNTPSLWPLSVAQDIALKQVKASYLQEVLVARKDIVCGASMADISTTVGAMHVAGIMVTPGAGPAIYPRSGDSAYAHEKRFLGRIIGLAEAVEIQFDIGESVAIDFLRIDIPALPGTYRFSDILFGDHPIPHVASRVIAAVGDVVKSDDEDEIVMFSADGAPSFELDVRELPVGGTLRIRVRRHVREPFAFSYERVLAKEALQRSREGREQFDELLTTLRTQTERIAQDLQVEIREGRRELALLSQYEHSRGFFAAMRRGVARVLRHRS